MLVVSLVCPFGLPVFATEQGTPDNPRVINKPMTEEEQKRHDDRIAERESREAEERAELEDELAWLEYEFKEELAFGDEAGNDVLKDMLSDINKIRRKLGLPTYKMSDFKSPGGSSTNSSSGSSNKNTGSSGGSSSSGNSGYGSAVGSGASGGGLLGADDLGLSDFDVDGEEEEEVEIRSPNSTQKQEIGDEVGDLVVSDKVYVTSGKTRVTEIYSINNQYGDCYYRPKAEDIPLLGERVCKLGQYTAAYTGFFDIGWSEPAKPKGEQSRALEILGYDYLFKEENFDTKSKKYSRTLIGTTISQETAIMNIYKALGLEQYDMKMYHTKGMYNKGNSPTGSLLNRDSILYKIRKGNSSTVETFDAYETYVFVTRTNPLLYMRKLQNDFNIPISSDKSATMTLEDFIIMCYKMMSFYGEPVLSKQETNQLLQVYGAEVPIGMSAEFEEAWMYLKARGVLNIDNDRLNGNLTKSDMYDILMCIKDSESRTNYKEVQLSYNLNMDVVSKGYYPSTVTVTNVDTINIEGQLSYENATTYDYLIPINDYSKFIGTTGEELSTQFVSDNPEAVGSLLPGSAYVGIVDDKYYHFVIPISSPDTINGYFRVETPGIEDKPGAIMLFEGGGIYRYDNGSGIGKDKINYFKRRPFSDIEYPDYVDKERKTGVNDFDYDSWGTKTDYIYVPEEDKDKNKPPDIQGSWGFDAWLGPFCRDDAISGDWIQDDKNGKWRFYISQNDGEDRTYLKDGGYYIGESSSGDIASNMFMFDANGYMLTGWYSEGHLWAYFKEDGHLAHDETLTIEGVEYEFDQWGWWIDNDWNKPDDREDIWGHLSNIVGQWIYDETEDKWWFMLSDGNYPIDGVQMIGDRYYCFDDSGYMVEGWWTENEEDYFYFYPEEGYMAMNTTVDGYRVGANGLAIGKVNMSMSEVFTKYASKLFSYFMPFNAYAAPGVDVGVDNSLGSLVSTNTNRLYRVKIYDGTVEESYDEIQYKVRATGVRDPKFERSSASWTGVPYIVVISTLNPKRVASLLTYKSNTDNLTLVNTQMAITQFGGADSNDMSMLVPFEELVEAGLFMDEVRISDDGNEIQLWGIASQTIKRNQMAGRMSFGEIRLNKADNTILVGPSVYSLRENQQLWYIAPSDENIAQSYTWIDSSGNIANVKNSVLYVDFRIIYGWASNEIKLYQMNVNVDTNLSTQKQIVVSAGKAMTSDDASGEDIEVRQVYVGINSNMHVASGWNTCRVLPSYTADGHSAFLAANSYQLATWALLVNNIRTGTENVSVITYFPKLAFSQLGVEEPSGDKGIDGLKGAMPKGRKVIESEDHVCRYSQIQIQGVSNKGDSLTVGKWYRDKNFGYVYIMPTEQEWKNNNGYKKWVSDEWSLPMVKASGTQQESVIDMSMPAFQSSGVKYGDLRVDTNTTKMVPCISSLSRYLYKEPVMSMQNLSTARPQDSVGGTNNRTYENYFFGVHQLKKEGSDWYIAGIGTQAGQEFKVNVDEVGELKFIQPIRVYQAAYSGEQDMKTYEVYTAAPSSITYVEASGEKSVEGGSKVFGGDPLNVFRDFDKFTFDNAVEWLDSTLTLVIVFAVEVLPLLLFTLSLVVFGFALTADFKVVKMFCNKIFDPIKFCTGGRKDVNNVGGIKFFICVLLITAGFALCVDGNIIRIMQWIFEIVGTYLNMLGNTG